MKFASKALLVLLVSATALAQQPQNPFANFKHVVVIFQENRTPDNLFQGLFGLTGSNGLPYNIQNFYTDPTGVQHPLAPVPLANNFDIDHSHHNFKFELNNPGVPVSPGCGPNTFACALSPWNQFMFVDDTQVSAHGVTQGVLDPYLNLAKWYGWGNFMYQTNQGPSYPAHQFIFGGTSAMTAADDGNSIFVSENFGQSKQAGCLAKTGETNSKVFPNPSGVCPKVPPPGFDSCTCDDNNTVLECSLTNTAGGEFCVGFNNAGHNTMATLLDNATTPVSWKYYAPSPSSAGSIWTAPDAINSICRPNATFTQCTGSEWTADVDFVRADVLNDISQCNLPGVSWVIPDGLWSDHANVNAGLGPSWVATVINTIGNNAACPNGEVYWQDTAIIVTWDDWGGWFDHVPPATLNPGPPCTSNNCPGDYQYGFRVPLIVVSAYTPQGYVNNAVHDFGSVLRMIEGTFHLGEGSLGFADARATNDLRDFFSLTTPRAYPTVPTIEGASFFLNFVGPVAPPDVD